MCRIFNATFLPHKWYYYKTTVGEADGINNNSDAEFVERHADTVYKLALSRTKDPSAAADVFQEAFYRYFKKRPAFVSDEHGKAWMIRVTINCSNNFLGSLWRKKTVPLGEVTGEQPPHEYSGLLDEVMRLPRRYRTVICLFYYEGLRVSEIAAVTGTKESTVKSHLHRARIMLKERLVGYEF